MSVQFGRWNFDSAPCSPEYVERVSAMIAPYGPDSDRRYQKDGVCILFHSFNTTRQSCNERQPQRSLSGDLVVWDGRLDNRAELLRAIGIPQREGQTDLEIVISAYDAWGTSCLGRLIGDWAMSIWNPREKSLCLARDPIGVKQLYYSVQRNGVTWSTLLDPLVALSDNPVEVDREYVAGWLVFSPATHLSPYCNIRAVPPSNCVRITPTGTEVRKFWDFNPEKRVRYQHDQEYEQEFRDLFGESVRRRLRCAVPVLSELSGGMDSSSIVCMADTVISGGLADVPRLDTVSYYDDSDPNWNERPYFAEVEKKRGRTGHHINAAVQRSPLLALGESPFRALPTAAHSRSDATDQFAALMRENGYRVVLSGTGGDEVTGGVPTPTPELADLMVQVSGGELAHKLKLWALHKRRPWFHLFFETVRDFFPRSIVGVPEHRKPAAWFAKQFVDQHRDALMGYEPRLRVFGALPTFQVNIDALNGLRGQLSSAYLSQPPSEKRYPYLDRDLLEFLYAVPRDQIIRPGQRRSLMRRALSGIVPDALLRRRRKAFAARTPLWNFQQHWDLLVRESRHMVSEELGIVDSRQLMSAIQNATAGKDVSIPSLLRTFMLETWLRGLSQVPTAVSRPKDATTLKISPRKWADAATA